jgi:hypothetical protein
VTANEAELKAAGVEAVLKPPDRVVHLLVGLNADQYAARDAQSARQALRRKPCSAIALRVSEDLFARHRGEGIVGRLSQISGRSLAW